MIKKYIRYWPYVLICIGLAALIIRAKAKDQAKHEQLKKAREAKKRKRARQEAREEASGGNIFVPIDERELDTNENNGTIILEADEPDN